jgi:hypothetical protein
MDDEYESWIWSYWQKKENSKDNDADRDSERQTYYRLSAIDPEVLNDNRKCRWRQ